MNETNTVGGFKVGDEVKVVGERDDGNTAKIIDFYSDIPGGVRLDTPIDGFVSWNVADLRLVSRNT